MCNYDEAKKKETCHITSWKNQLNNNNKDQMRHYPLLVSVSTKTNSPHAEHRHKFTMYKHMQGGDK